MTGKREAERFGRWAERAASVYLALKGYRILARRFRSPAGEIDLVARRGRLVVYVEVKARRGEPAEIPGRQRRRILRAAEHFLKLRPELASCDQRFDAILIRPARLPTHLKDAWRG
ncbi:MAG: YraN family protein [Defluviicoccus sp.]|nr:YraN family protein [Defluviicoccus sp.]MDE0382561.1 YraN family protein [Defluviicoccus sp.]